MIVADQYGNTLYDNGVSGILPDVVENILSIFEERGLKYAIDKAVYDTKKDILWNQSQMFYTLPTLRGGWVATEILLNHDEIINYDNGKNIYRLYLTIALDPSKNRIYDPRYDPKMSGDIVDEITRESGLDHDIVWQFLYNLWLYATKGGNILFINPKLEKKMADVNDESWIDKLLKQLGWLVGIVVIGGVAYFILDHYSNEKEIKVEKIDASK
jgi:hypothetical protein